MKPWILTLVIILIISTTAMAISLPTNFPTVISQVAQKDKAAVVLINSVVTGTAVVPSYEITFPSSIVGAWVGDFSTIFFYDDETVAELTEEGDIYEGTYEMDDTFLIIYFDDGLDVGFTYLIEGNTLILSTDEVDLYYVKVDGDDEESSGMLAVMESMVLIRDESAAGQLMRTELATGVSGTGFIVSSDGYIVTNAHVVLQGEDPEEMLFGKFAKISAEESYAVFADSYNIPDEEKEQIAYLMFLKVMDYFLTYGSIENIETNYYVLNGVASPGQDLTATSWRATLKKQGTVWETVQGEISWGRDVAILKVEQDNLPTVILGDSDTAQVGDPVFIIGYPGTDVEEYFKPTAELEPTVTQGVVSARRTLKSGVEAIQTDAAINHGNSGGPVYNQNGEVIGIATFGAGPEVGIEAIKFMMPIKVAQEMLNELNVQNTHSAVDFAFYDGLIAFWNWDCPSTITHMDTVLSMYPNHPNARAYLAECQRALAAGEDVVPQKPEPPKPDTTAEDILFALLILGVPFILGGVVILSLIAMFFIFAKIFGNKDTPVKTAAPKKKGRKKKK